MELCISNQMLIRHYDDSGMTEMYVGNLGALMDIMYCGQKCYAIEDVSIKGGKVESVPISCTSVNCGPNHMLLYSDSGIENGLANRLRG